MSAPAAASPASRRHRRRRMFGEFLVVMFGVLVALALEQAVSNWQERHRVEASIEAMNEELVDLTYVFDIRAQVSGCATAKLDALDAALLAGPGPASVPLASIGRTPYFFSSRGARSSAASELLARHRGPRVARQYGEIYQGMEEFSWLAQSEQQSWAALQTLEGQPVPADPERRWRLREHIATARNTNALLTAIAEQMNALIATLVGDMKSEQAAPDLRDRPICQPLEGGA